MSASPVPERSPAEEVAVMDKIIRKIEQSLPAIRLMADKSVPRPATSRLSREQVVRVQEVCQNMRDDPLLTVEGDDICLEPKKQTIIDNVNGKINGKH